MNTSCWYTRASVLFVHDPWDKTTHQQPQDKAQMDPVVPFAATANQTGVHTHWQNLLHCSSAFCTDWINGLTQKEISSFPLIAGMCPLSLILITFLTGNVVIGVWWLPPSWLAFHSWINAQDFKAWSTDRFYEHEMRRGNPFRELFAWHPPDHRPQEPRPIDDGRHSLIHERVCFDEVQGIVRKLIGGCILF